MLKHRARAVFLLVAAIVIGYFVANSGQFRLGLDLSGGTHLVYQADVSKIPSGDISASMSSLRDVIERRVNSLGVSEPLVQTQQGAALSSKETAYKLIVELPGITDVNEAVKAIDATPSLEFKVITAKVLKDFQSSANASTTLDATSTQQALVALYQTTGLTGRMVTRASVQFNQTTAAPTVGLQFTSEGRDLFAKITREHVGDYIGIFLDGALISNPVVNEEIPNGQAQISGSFTLDEAKTLVRNLNFGALPVPVSLVSTQTIGPTLGQAAVKGGIETGIVAYIIIGLFLLLYYRLPGLVATIALAIYAVLMLAIFKFIGVTLTAAGIAGFILSVGMAVDANILIFERMKEELKAGRGVWDAMHEGFARAWLSIRDSNVSSIITGVILYYFGSTSVVTGFALVFVIGVLGLHVYRYFRFTSVPLRCGSVEDHQVEHLPYQ